MAGFACDASDGTANDGSATATAAAIDANHRIRAKGQTERPLHRKVPEL